MKRTIEKSTVETSGLGEVGQFKMLVNEKSFSIIISGIYSDKIKAIIREYGCNAVDSHKEAGHAKPFDVHLPSYENPNFYIRDYGVGLDEEDIINVFTVAFASTKENSNLCTGMLGIGAMSGFCYNTKSFTVTSWKNGKKYIYHCFLGDAGVPSYTKLLEENSDEPTGVKVEFPAGNDSYAFERKAVEVFKWFDIKPNFVGYNKPVMPYFNREEAVGGTNWFLTNDGKSCRLLMGNVVYDVDEGDVALSKYSNHIGLNIIIEAPMGSVDFQPSRERLQYTPKTVAFLRKTFLNITKEVGEMFESKIKEAESLWEAKRVFSRLTEKDMASVVSLIDDYSSIKWNGQPVGNGQNFQVNLTEKDDLEVYKLRCFEKIKWRYAAREYSGKYISPIYNHVIFINDLKRGQVGRIKHYLTSGTIDSGAAFVFEPVEGKTLQDVQDYLKKKLGCLDKDIGLTSKLEEPPKTSTYRRGKLGKISTWVNDIRVTYAWEEKDFGDEDIETGTFYYVERKGYKYVDQGTKNENHPQDLSYYKKFIETELGTKITIYGVATKELENLPDNWVEFTNEVKEKLEKNKKDAQDYLDNIHYFNTLNQYYNTTKAEFLSKTLLDIKDSLPDKHNLIDWLENKTLLYSLKKVKEPTNYSYTREFFNLQPVEPKIDFKKEVLDKYPLISFCAEKSYRPIYGYYSSKSKYEGVSSSDILNYILGVDNYGENL